MPTDSRLFAGEAANAAIDTMTASHQETLRTMETAGAAMIDGLTKVQREMAEFVSERIRKDLEIHQELLRCRTFADFTQVQSRFVKTAVDQYSAEATKLLKLSGEMLAKGLEPREI